MNWQSIREQYPNQWLVIEAREAHNDGERALDLIEVVALCTSFQEATHRCSDVHYERPQAELYCVNTEWDVLNIGLPMKISPVARKYATRIKRRSSVAG